MVSKKVRRIKIKSRIRGKISGTSARPRLSIFRSNRQIYAQIINDETGKTLASASSLKKQDSVSKKEIASMVGVEIANAAKAIGISSVVFDRNGFLYHGRVKELADAARGAGLNF